MLKTIAKCGNPESHDLHVITTGYDADMPNDADEIELEQEIERRLTSAGYTNFKCGYRAFLKTGEWWDLISRTGIGRYWECFDLLEPLMSDQEYANTVREIWVATKGLSPEEAKRRLLDHSRTISTRMWMRDDDAETYRGLPDVVTIYRGCEKGNERGWSWTLDRKRAKHFAAKPFHNGCPGPTVAISGTVPKDQIIALFSGMWWFESEVIVPGESVTIIAIDDFSSLSDFL